MVKIEYILQPDNATCLNVLRRNLAGRNLTNLDAAMAYATPDGVKDLCGMLKAALGDDAWERLRKRWLIGIDWCRSRPSALDMLSELHRSSVRIPDGAPLVARPGCTPRRTYHPKGIILKGADSTVLLSGSGNLSGNGMGRGCELGSVLVIETPLEEGEADFERAGQEVKQWFDQNWRRATGYADIKDDYLEVFQKSATRPPAPIPTDDDATDVGELGDKVTARGAMTPEQFRMLRTCDHLWFEYWKGTKNRKGRPGNQVFLKKFTRVFFGFPATDLAENEPVGHVTIGYRGVDKPDCSVTYSDNQMDKLTLPFPDPDSFDDEVLMLKRSETDDGIRFDLTVGTRAQVKDWKARSAAIGGSFKLSSGRKWGVF